ncbi:uncharacterized protein LOC144349440 [Saccoglossus kowalevskii]
MMSSKPNTGEDDDDDDVDFDFFIEEIGTKINERAFRVLKRISGRRVSERNVENMNDPAELIRALVDAAVITNYNLGYLIRMLRTAENNELANRVEEYQNQNQRTRTEKKSIGK